MKNSEEISGCGIRFRFCPRCAEPLAPRVGPDGAERPTCPTCGYVRYRNPIAVVATLLLARDAAGPAPNLYVPPAEATHALFVRRTATYAGSWCVPCGYIEYGEEIRAAAARECREETGLEVSIEGIFAVLSNFHDPPNLTVGTWFLARRCGGALQPGDDADRAAFFPLDEPPEPLAFPTDREVLRRLRAARPTPPATSAAPPPPAARD